MHVRLHAGEVVAHGGRADDAGARVAERTTEFCASCTTRSASSARRRARRGVRRPRRGAHRLSRAARPGPRRSRASCRRRPFDKVRALLEHGARADARRARAPRRVLRLRRHVRGRRAGDLGEDGPRPSARLRVAGTRRRSCPPTCRASCTSTGSPARRRIACRCCTSPRCSRARRVTRSPPVAASSCAVRAAGRIDATWITRLPRRQFVADEARTDWHDQALWFVRAKRDRAAAACPEWEALRERAAAIKAHTLIAPGRLPRAVRGQRARASGARSTGRATPPSTTGSCTGSARAARRPPRREEQVDAHRGVRPQPVPRGARHRGGRHRPRRADRAAAPRAAQPHRAAGDPHQEGRGRRTVPRAARHADGTRRSRPRSPRPRASTCARSSSPPTRRSPA